MNVSRIKNRRSKSSVYAADDYGHMRRSDGVAADVN
jgi:hypothetical protein